MSQIYKDGSFFSGGGSKSTALEEIAELQTKIESLQEELDNCKQQLVTLSSSLGSNIASVQSQITNLDNSTMKFSNITKSTAITEAGKYAIDATEMNVNIKDSIAYKLKDHTDNIYTLATRWNNEHIENFNYTFSSILGWANSVPAGSTSTKTWGVVDDIPDGYDKDLTEFNAIKIGSTARYTVILIAYGDPSVIFVRSVFNNAWLTDWKKIMTTV